MSKSLGPVALPRACLGRHSSTGCDNLGGISSCGGSTTDSTAAESHNMCEGNLDQHNFAGVSVHKTRGLMQETFHDSKMDAKVKLETGKCRDSCTCGWDAVCPGATISTCKTDTDGRGKDFRDECCNPQMEKKMNAPQPSSSVHSHKVELKRNCRSSEDPVQVVNSPQAALP